MTTRRKFADIFWFTFFHEIGHIINEDIEDKLIDYDFAKGESEDGADKFAANTLIDAEEYDSFVKKGDFSLPGIKRFCVDQGIPTYILIGRLQRDKRLKYYQYPGEKVKYALGKGEVCAGKRVNNVRSNFEFTKGTFRNKKWCKPYNSKNK